VQHTTSQAGDTNPLESFRAATRAWLEANCLAEMRTPQTMERGVCWGGRSWQFESDAQRLWLERMVAKGWTVPQWSREYGGAGLDFDEAKILREEMQALGCRPPLTSFGIWMLGPVLLKYGSEAQRREYLPPIARGEIRWCQGYSEPGAGSDLASLQTRADDQGDHFLVNGSKIWTSYGDKADWIFCLVRTDPTALKHTGISFLLFDMQSPGVSTRPITLISGKSPFTQTFFDDVRVPKGNIVGELNKGWDIAKYLLGHERNAIGSSFGARYAQQPLGAQALAAIGLRDGMLDEPVLRAQIAQFEVDAAAFDAWVERSGDLDKLGQMHPALPSALKYYGSELNKRRFELLMSSNGAAALDWEGARSDDGELARTWLRSKGNSIEGGTSEIQLNIIAKRILSLPGA
jgi:alkylation response protein AidB-like acyl-CoA dehydrogenase